MKVLTEKQITDKWTREAKAQLVGRTITAVRYMTKPEAEAIGWYHRGLVITLDNGALVVPYSDDEGNAAGALVVGEKLLPVL